jgi:hypothetical protein
MNRSIITLLFCLSLTACQRHETREAEPPQPAEAIAPGPSNVEQALEQARAIVSDPSNWKSHAEKITKLGELAQDLGVADTEEYKRFDDDAQKLLEFGTRMISNLDEASVNRLRVQLNEITGNSRARADTSVVLPNGLPVIGKIDTKSEEDLETRGIDEKAESIVYKSIEGLGAAEASEFGVLFARAQVSYRALRSLLLNKEANKTSLLTPAPPAVPLS